MSKICDFVWSRNKNGFTVVELVIVIAVIAILAAILIPTFSSLAKKANLSADKQAVREMNLALAADEALHGKCATLEQAMQVLANAGYNSDNWVCLTKGYEVYWWSKENRMVLYNASTAEVEYPEDFDIKNLVTASDGGEFYVYNENHLKAVSTNVSLGSSASTSNLSGLASSAAATTATAQSSLAAISTTLSSNQAVKNALGLSTAQYAYGTKEVTSNVYGADNNNAYATMQVVAVGDTSTPELKSNGEVKENVFYVAIQTEGTPTAANIASAQKAAGDMVYAVFTQINTAQLSSDNVAIVLAPGTEIDVSGKEWAAVKTFEGYFGTTDASNPIIINGAELTSATGYSQTVGFTGSNSKYFVTGFFGTIYGNTTVENVTFKNITLNEPATDFEITKFQINGKAVDSRNSIGIIGGITDNGNNTAANVVLKNITVDASCEVKCGADGGGLVGYIGGTQTSNSNVDGYITIDNCHVSAKVSNNYSYVSTGYGPVGGMVGFLCRVKPTLVVTFKDCTFDGSVDGTTMIGACIGDVTNKVTINFTGTNNFAGAKLNQQAKAKKVGGIAGTVTNTDAAGVITLGGSVSIPSGVAAYNVGSDAYDINKNKI